MTILNNTFSVQAGHLTKQSGRVDNLCEHGFEAFEFVSQEAPQQNIDLVPSFVSKPTLVGNDEVLPPNLGVIPRVSGTIGIN